MNILRWVNETFGVGPGDRLLFVTVDRLRPLGLRHLGMLGAGGTVRIATEEELGDPQRLARILRDEADHVWDSAPAALQQLVPSS